MANKVQVLCFVFSKGDSLYILLEVIAQFLNVCDPLEYKFER